MTQGTAKDMVRVWDKENDIEKVKSLANEHLDKLEASVATLFDSYKTSYPHEQFLSFMVSKDNRAVIKFSKPPTVREIDNLIHVVFLQKDCLEDHEANAA